MKKQTKQAAIYFAVIIFAVIGCILFGSCRTIYVDRPYYVTDSVKYTLRDTIILSKTDTVPKIAAKPLKNSTVEIDTKYLLARAWVNADSLFLSAQAKQYPDTLKIPGKIQYITITPASTVIEKPKYIYPSSDRFLENFFYFSGWALWVLLVGATGFGIVKLAMKAKIL